MLLREKYGPLPVPFPFRHFLPAYIRVSCALPFQGNGNDMDTVSTINEQQKKISDEKAASYMRALAEFIFEAWREQRSSAVNPLKGLDSSGKTDHTTSPT
jgi:hypothetical protein